jgi:hypothetical protein
MVACSHLTRRAGAALFVLLLAGCGSFFPTRPGSPAFGEAIDIENGTTLAVTIIVNGAPVGTVGPHDGASIAGAALPPKPWDVTAVSPSGRQLLRFGVRPGQVFATTNPDGSTTMNGAGTRVDLPCGRLDVTVGGPMLGPAPAPATGPCEP